MDDSITSTDENKKRPNNLFLEINKINTEEWRNEEFSFSPNASFHSSFDHQEDTSFNNELPLQSKICEDLLEVQDVLEVTHRQAADLLAEGLRSQNKSQGPASSLSSNNNVPSQVTITLHEESLASKAFEDIQTQDDSNFSTSLRSFLTLNDKNYRPHVICLKFLFSKLKEHSRQSLQNLKLYIHFLEIKIKQETRSLKPLDEYMREPKGEDEDEVNIDEKVLMEVMQQEMDSRRTKRRTFQAQIKQIHEELLSTWRKIKEKREKRQRYIEEEIIRVIDRIELEMEDMIKCRLLNEREKADNKFISEKIKSQNPYLTKDKYLEMKYLIQRQNAYLKLITEFNGKLITYMINMFSKEEVQITTLIQEALVDYSNAYINCYDQRDQILTLKIEKAEEAQADRKLKHQLASMLLTFIPKELYDINQNQHKFEHTQDKLEAILGDFSNYLQNTIFISTIQMNNQFILFRNQALWKTSKSFFEKDENYIDYESKQALANSKSTNHPHAIEYNPTQDVKIVVVLTSNYYLHLEKEDKIATVRLGDVKLSKRGREVIISDKGKGIGGYLGLKTELGRLQFDTTEEVEIFAQKLSVALRRLTYA